MKKAVAWMMVLGLSLFLLGGCGGDDDEEAVSSDVLVGSESSLSSAVISEAPEMAKVAVVKDAASGLRVRATASSEGEILAVVQNNDIFRLLSEELIDDWYQIYYLGQTAYLYKDYVDVQEITVDELTSIEASLASEAESASSESSVSSENSTAEESSTSGDEPNTRDQQDME